MSIDVADAMIASATVPQQKAGSGKSGAGVGLTSKYNDRYIFLMQRRKAENRQRILEAAARVLRREGYAAAGVDALAAEAGLTSGAIYGHFKGKRDVLTAVVRQSVSANESIREAGLEDLRGGAWVRAMLRRYLSPEHHAAVEHGCPMPALVSELARAGDEPRAAFAEAVGALLDRMAVKWAEGESSANAPELRRRAMAALAMAVGGIALARAVGDDELAGALLDACRDEGAEALTREKTDATTQGAT